MKYLLLTFVLLSLTVGFGIANEFNNTTLSRDEYVGVTANEFCRQTAALMARKLMTLDLDPLMIPYMELNTTFNFLFQEHDLKMKLSNLIVLGLTTITKADSDCLLNYDLRFLRVEIPIKLGVMNVYSDFVCEALGFKPEGTATGEVMELLIFISFLVDMKATTMNVQDFRIQDTGKMELQVSDLGLLTPIANIVIDFITVLFKDNIMDTVSGLVLEKVNEVLAEIGNVLPEMPEDVPPMATKGLKFHF